MRRRKPSDRLLRRWLRTGRPTRIGKLIETDELVSTRLDDLTRLDRSDIAALDELVTPMDEFKDRMVEGVQARRNSGDTASVVVDLLSLGFQFGRTMLNRPPDDDEGKKHS